MNKLAKEQKRTMAKTVDAANEKYIFRIWLLALGMGGDEFKTARRVLLHPPDRLRRLQGSDHGGPLEGKAGHKKGCGKGDRKQLLPCDRGRRNRITLRHNHQIGSLHRPKSLMVFYRRNIAYRRGLMSRVE